MLPAYLVGGLYAMICIVIPVGTWLYYRIRYGCDPDDYVPEPAKRDLSMKERIAQLERELKIGEFSR